MFTAGTARDAGALASAQAGMFSHRRARRGRPSPPARRRPARTACDGLDMLLFFRGKKDRGAELAHKDRGPPPRIVADEELPAGSRRRFALFSKVFRRWRPDETAKKAALHFCRGRSP